MRVTTQITCLSLSLLLSIGASAQEAYFYLPLLELDFGEDPGRFTGAAVERPRLILDGPGEAYVFGEMNRLARDSRGLLEPLFAAIRLPEQAEILGHLSVPNSGGAGMLIPFRIPAEAADLGLAHRFYQARRDHYSRLLDTDLPGYAWFRFRQREAESLLANTKFAVSPRWQSGRLTGRVTDLNQSYDLFTGGRALSENLQLDHQLIARGGSGGTDETIPLTEIAGIDTREMDFSALVGDAQPELDPLASLVPADQHALFFPSFQAMVDTLDEAEEGGTPVLQLFELRSEDARTAQRYQYQLCLPLNSLARLLGPHVINSVAITGSDPYLRTGSDLAVLFEPRDASALETALLSCHAQTALVETEARSIQGELLGVRYQGLRTPTRSVSSYVARVGGAVVVTNSLAQLEAIAETFASERPALNSAPEYAFFRLQYQRGDPDENAFLVLTDATIRRWCSPRWRIGASRRIRVAALLSELQADWTNRARLGDGHPLKSRPMLIPGGGKTGEGPAGAESTVYGNLAFMTPIIELPITQVTSQERAAYQRWQRRYQRDFIAFFDPIAVRLALAPDRLELDLMVIPLIAGTDYRDLVQTVGSAQISPQAGDRHEDAILHLAMAFDRNSRQVRSITNHLDILGRELNPLDWIGESLFVYADADPFWSEWAAAENLRSFFWSNLHRLPVALEVSVQSSMRLALFMAGVQDFVNRSAPGMASWEIREHNEQPYAAIVPRDDELENLRVYYATLSDALIVTLNEEVLKRALDRRRAEDGPHESLMPWLGQSLCLQARRDTVELLEPLVEDSYMRAGSWSNLPILNEWRQLFPDRDPLEVHQHFWKTHLICPGGGEYVWNQQWQTMESTIFGHPGQPRSGPSMPPILRQIGAANFGITFQHDGLSARVVLHREGSPE